MSRDSKLTLALCSFLMGIFVAMGCERKHPAPNAQDRDHGVLVWVRSQGIPRGGSRTLELPLELRTASVDGIVHAARTTDGRTCVLVKTHIGFKDNFEGRLRIDGPLHSGELIEKVPRPYISLAGLPAFEELYVRASFEGQSFDVYFDLN